MFGSTNSTKIYLFLVSFIGLSAFLLMNNPSQLAISQWYPVFMLAGAVLVANHNVFELPPNGNSISMDSAIFLASLFLFGLNVTLTASLVFALIYLFTQRKTEWWKHVFNFSLYALMIIGANFIFLFTGGVNGNIDFTQLWPYLAALSVYFAINVLLISLYFVLAASDHIVRVLKGMFLGTAATYVSTMLFSLVLVTLIDAQGMFGLFLFICISVLLSIAFKQHSILYHEAANRANKDHLTTLNNHGYFKELLEKELKIALETEKPLSIALLDIDDFKKYNDLHGHIKGDQLLRDFGALLKAETEARDFIVARYGGEEFSLIMPNTLKSEALTFINHLRKKTNDTPFEGVDVLPYGCLSFSAGIAESTSETYSTSELLNKADLALYSVKDQGKNMVRVYNEHADYSLQRSTNFEKELEDAEQQLRIFLSKDVYTYRHSKRVFQYAADFARTLNLSENERENLILGALVHDIGKLEIPRDLINKTGRLEPHEWEMMKKHVTWGKEIISTNKKLADLIPLIELHHERYDGYGYPYGLKGKSIPKLARVLCVIDSFDAMTTERPYQKTKTYEEAFVELRKCQGKQFDPDFVEPFINMIQKNYGLEGNDFTIN